jgi:hypothetical protein
MNLTSFFVMFDRENRANNIRDYIEGKARYCLHIMLPKEPVPGRRVDQWQKNTKNKSINKYIDWPAVRHE